MAQHNEIEFEKEICEHLAANGWLYSPTTLATTASAPCSPRTCSRWLADTQPEQLEKVVKPGAGDIAKQQGQLLDRIVKVLDTPLENGGGTLNLLRKGFSHLSAKFRMCEFRPESTLNAEAQRRLRRRPGAGDAPGALLDRRPALRRPGALRQRPAGRHARAEDRLHADRSGRDQPVQDQPAAEGPGTSKPQPLFVSGARALVHFAVSNDEVWMTTRLAGENTHFLPFNRGTDDGGAGNPLNPDGSPSAYLWERVLQRDSLLNILGRFMYVKHETTTDPITGKTSKSASLRFPRFHQWEAVTNVTAAVTGEGVGHRYLIQHSAGSGKTDSIAWTAHRMARLQVDNEKVFDSVIVVTDRNVLDAQLQDAIKQIDNDQGIVVAIDRDEATRPAAPSPGCSPKR